MGANAARLCDQLEAGELVKQQAVDVGALTDQHDDVGIAQTHRQLPQTLDRIGVDLGRIRIEARCALQFTHRVLIIVQDNYVHSWAVVPQTLNHAVGKYRIPISCLRVVIAKAFMAKQRLSHHAAAVQAMNIIAFYYSKQLSLNTLATICDIYITCPVLNRFSALPLTLAPTLLAVVDRLTLRRYAPLLQCTVTSSALN